MLWDIIHPKYKDLLGIKLGECRTLWGECERVVVCLKTTLMHISSSATDHYDRSSGAVYGLLSVSILRR